MEERIQNQKERVRDARDDGHGKKVFSLSSRETNLSRCNNNYTTTPGIHQKSKGAQGENQTSRKTSENYKYSKK